ncbi:hypothetical protein WKI65_43420 [Streptomyces sp. MS1.AVA.3]|uniref:hypothetical protein n=1 Tax=Streptomyces decoyicus TaxID=249567 RepID=UPI0030BC1686
MPKIANPLADARELVHDYLNSDSLAWPQDYAENDARITEWITAVQTANPTLVADAQFDFINMKSRAWYEDYDHAMETWAEFVAKIEAAPSPST